MRHQSIVGGAGQSCIGDDNPCESYPHFFCIGPGNSGTTWIADHLKLQRDVWLPPIQELGYLNAGFERFRDSDHLTIRWDWWSVAKRIVRNKSFSLKEDRRFLESAQRLADVPNTKRDLNLYRKLFEPASGRITGDITPSYAGLDEADIRDFAPVLKHARIFMIARDPVERFWSAISMFWRDRVFGDVDYHSPEFARTIFEKHANQNLLSGIVRRWHSGIGEDRLKIFFFDDLASEPGQAYREIVEFIGADIRKRIPLISPRYNRKAGALRLRASPEVREWVRNAFQEELHCCADMFGKRGEKWLRRHSKVIKA